MSLDRQLHFGSIWRACEQLPLSPRAQAPVDQLLQQLPQKFVCVHWRGGDLMDPRHLLQYNNMHMSNSTFVADLAAAAARAVGAEHILLVTNVDARLAATFEAEASLP
eukprot:540137-Prymnesium_polylepis.1